MDVIANTNWAVMTQFEDGWIDSGITLVLEDFEDDVEILDELAKRNMLYPTEFDLDGDEHEIAIRDANSGALLYVLVRAKRRLRALH